MEYIEGKPLISIIKQSKHYTIEYYEYIIANIIT